MRTIIAVTPGGAEWRVRVVWVPRWRALARRFGGWRRNRRGGGGGGGWDIPDIGGGDDLLAVVAVIVGLILFGLLFWFLLLPLLLLIVDILVVLVLFAVAIPARVLFRRPWVIEAVPATTAGGAERFTTQTVGWRAALRTRDEIVRSLQQGLPVRAI